MKWLIKCGILLEGTYLKGWKKLSRGRLVSMTIEDSDNSGQSFGDKFTYCDLLLDYFQNKSSWKLQTFPLDLSSSVKSLESGD